MNKRYIYKVLKSSHGIAIWITCSIQPLGDKNTDNLFKVSDSIYLGKDKEVIHLNADEIDYLRKGVLVVHNQLLQKLEQLPVVIQIHELVFAYVDYQPEGLFMAMAGWLRQEYGVTFTEPTVTYDKQNHRYIFDFESD